MYATILLIIWAASGLYSARLPPQPTPATKPLPRKPNTPRQPCYTTSTIQVGLFEPEAQNQNHHNDTRLKTTKKKKGFKLNTQEKKKPTTFPR